MKYLITYDLNSPGQNYNALYEAIKKLGDWQHPLQNTWFVDSSYSASQIRDHLKEVVDRNDKIFVCEIGTWASWDMSDASDWLNNR
jgi:CRISPR/Cas system-associated endoribonuclease Cas2